MNPDDFISFAKIVGKSKKIKRAGWVREKILNPESVAEHCFRLIIFSMVLAPILKLNQEKLIKMAIIHDLGETKTGDIVVERGKKIDSISRLKKEELEEKAIDELMDVFGNEYHEIFHELKERKTKEAKIFWQIDKLEMAMSAKEYEEEQKKDLSEFFINAKINIKEPLLKQILMGLLS